MRHESLTEFGKVRGWLVVFLVVLVFHGLTSLAALFVPGLRAMAGVRGSDLMILGCSAVGSLAGIFLILTRNRAAPLFFTVYPPLLLGVNLVLPGFRDAVHARLGAILGDADLTGSIAVDVVLAGVVVAYWARSRRVEAVFGSRGLQLLVGAHGEPGSSRGEPHN